MFHLQNQVKDLFLMRVPVAQWVERLTGNQRVMSSMPVSDSEDFTSEKKKLVTTKITLSQSLIPLQLTI